MRCQTISPEWARALDLTNICQLREKYEPATLEIASKIADAALASAGELKLKPICVMILDTRASLRLCESGWHFYSSSPHCPWQSKCRPRWAWGRGHWGQSGGAGLFADAVGRMAILFPCRAEC